MGSDVSELIRPRHVAGGEDVGVQRLQIFVGYHGALGLNAQFFETVTGQPCHAAHGANQGIELDAPLALIVFDHDDFALAIPLAAHGLVAGEYADAIPGERRARELGDFFVFADHDACGEFDLRDFRSEPRKCLRQFAPDRPAAQYHQSGGRCVQSGEFVPKRVAGHITHSVQAGQGGYERARTCGNDDAARGKSLCSTVVERNFDRPRIDDASVALQYFHAEAGVALHAVVRLDGADDLMHARHYFAEAELRLDRFQSVVLAMAHLMREFRAFDQRLARHAAVVQAIPAHLVRFDQRYLGLDNGADIGGDQTGGTGPDHHQIAIEPRRPAKPGIHASSFDRIED